MPDTPFFEPWVEPAPPDDDDGEQDLPWMPPQHVVGVEVPLDADVARTADVVVRVTRATVYGRGLELTVATWVRPGTPRRADTQPGWNPDEPRTGVRLEAGIRLGHRAPFAPPEDEADPDGAAGGTVPGGRASWVQSDARGSGLHAERSWWLHPFPAGGRLEVVVAWPQRGVPESSIALDLAALRRAAEDEQVLWDPPPAPWESSGGWFGFSGPAPAYGSTLTVSWDRPDPADDRTPPPAD